MRLKSACKISKKLCSIICDLTHLRLHPCSFVPSLISAAAPASKYSSTTLAYGHPLKASPSFSHHSAESKQAFLCTRSFVKST